MIKYLFLILVTLLSGCTTDFSGLEKPEESVYIRFSSSSNIQVDVKETTRSGNTQSAGILGIATYSDEQMGGTTLAGCTEETLREWMANDRYYYTPSNAEEDKVEFVHQDGERPTFPIDKGSGMVVYAYIPHTERVEYGEGDCYIPLDLMLDSASTDWMYSGREAMSKEVYRKAETFNLNSFKHVMTRLDVVLDPELTKFSHNHSFTIKEIWLGIQNNIRGRFSIIDGRVEAEKKDVVSYTNEVYYLRRRKERELLKYNKEEHTESFYLMPGTEIVSLYIKGVWSDGRVVDEERLIEMNGIKLEAGKSTALPVKLTNNY